QVAIDAFALHQHLRRTVFADLARLQHDDPIEVAQAREPVRDGDDGAAAHQAVQGLAYGLLRLTVERRGGLIEQKNWRILEERAGNPDALALPGRQLHAAVADDRGGALGQIFDEGVAIGGDDRRMDVGIGGIRPTIADVLHDRAVKQRNVLRNEGNRGAQALLRDPGDVLAAEQNAPALQVVETLQQDEQGRLATTRLPDQAGALAGLDPQAEIGEHSAPVRISKVDTLEYDRRARAHQRGRLRMIAQAVRNEKRGERLREARQMLGDVHQRHRQIPRRVQDGKTQRANQDHVPRGRRALL